MRTAPKLALVLPCYNEEVVLPATAQSLLGVLKTLVAQGQIDTESFVYFVDDGSQDQTWSIIQALHQKTPAIKGLKLAHNCGHQNALLAGLLGARGRADCAISLDADLQHDEHAIPAFVEQFRAGADIVFGVRNDRSTDGVLKKFSALCFYGLMRLMGVNVLKNHADYRLVSARALDALAEYREVNLFLRGVFATMGFRTSVVHFNVKPRFAGESKYSLRKMLSLAIGGITSFSIVPLRLIAALGFVIFVASIAMSAYVLYIALTSVDAVPGWASTVLPIYFIGGVQLLSIGLLGEYVGRIYQETKARPRFLKDHEIF